MKRSTFVLMALLTLLTGAGHLHAAVRSWELDKAHSNFYFSIDHIYSKVRGSFAEFSGEILFDPAHLEQSKFAFTVQVKSIDTNIPKRDKHLLSADFFDAATHPEMTFVSRAITRTGENLYQVSGTLTVKGKAHDLVVPLTLAGIKPHPMEKGQEVAGFNGTLTVDRLALGVGSGKFYQMGLVGKDVEILISLEALSKK